MSDDDLVKTETIEQAEPGLTRSTTSESSTPMTNVKTNTDKPKSKKRWIIIAIVGGLLVLVGVGLLIWRPWDNVDDDQIEPVGDTEEVEDFAVPAEDKGSDETDAEGRMEDVTDDPIVQAIYQRFVGDAYYGANTAADGLWGFRFNSGMRDGQLDKYLMLTLAHETSEKTPCKGVHLRGNDGSVVEQCYSGEAMRREVRKLFGQEMQFVQGDKIGAICGGYHYDVESDEFAEVGDGCGFAASVWLGSAMIKAERSGDKLYIYEKVLYIEERSALYHIDDTDGVRPGEYIDSVEIDWSEFDEYEAYQQTLDALLMENVVRNGDEFKWTFRRVGDEEYVFEKVERLIE